MSSEGVCVKCGKPSTSKCGRCKVEPYCSKECQAGHWKEHKASCVPVTLKQGRDFLAANKVRHSDNNCYSSQTHPSVYSMCIECVSSAGRARQSKDGVVELKSGLQYKVLTKGAGTVHPKVDTPCLCHYAGSLIDGTEFDSSYKRGYVHD